MPHFSPHATAVPPKGPCRTCRWGFAAPVEKAVAPGVPPFYCERPGVAPGPLYGIGCGAWEREPGADDQEPT